MSPLYSGFGEALAGAASMRCYGAQRYFMGRQVVAVTRNQQVGSCCVCGSSASASSQHPSLRWSCHKGCQGSPYVLRLGVGDRQCGAAGCGEHRCTQAVGQL
jgi:hypothetical protein